jgi:hypothetical protein
MGYARVMGAHVAALARLDTGATEDAGNYDHEFREPKLVDDGTWAGASGRVDEAEIRVPCQVDISEFDRADPMLNGVETQHTLRLTFAHKDLVRAGLIDAGTNAAAIRLEAKLNGIYDRRGTLLRDMSADRLYCTQVQPAAFVGASISLLVCTFTCREAGTKN